jgi:RHS repeat-associated protein
MLYGFWRNTTGAARSLRCGLALGVAAVVRAVSALMALVVVGMLLGVLGSVSAAALMPAVASAESMCSDNWTGPSEGEWTTPGDWSAGHVPGSSDVACIGLGKTVKVASGTDLAGVVQGEGSLTISGGSLELTNTLEVSSIHSLRLSGGTLTGAATLKVSGSLLWESGTMSGLGTTILASGASGFKEERGEVYLEQRTLVNEGTFTFGSGLIRMSEGAEIKNTGTFSLNSTGTDLSAGSGAPPLFVNTGVLQKAAGSEVAQISVDFENKGAVNGKTGTIAFTNSSDTGTLASGSVLEGAVAINGPTVTGDGFSSPSGTVTLEGGSLSMATGNTATVAHLVMLSNGTLTGPGTMKVSGSLSWESGTMSGPGTTVLMSGATGSKEEGSWIDMAQRKFVNEGIFTLGTGQIVMSEGAEIKNAGTFNLNARGTDLTTEGSGAPPLFVNTGTVQKTASTEVAQINVDFENKGTVNGKTGTIAFTGSSMSGTLANGSVLEGAVSVGSGATVTGDNFSSSSGTVTLEGGTLSIASGDTATVVHLVMIDFGTLTGAGTMKVSGSLLWESGTMSGSGSTVLMSGATGVKEEKSPVNLNRRIFVNEGTFTMVSGQIVMRENAVIENDGTFNANAESSVLVPEGTESEAPLVVNMGTFEKTVGLETYVNVAFENFGIIQELSGKIIFRTPHYAEANTEWGGEENPNEPALCGESESVGCQTGNYSQTQTDFAIGGRGVGLDLSRTYNSQAAAAGEHGIFGYGWTSSFSDHLVVESSSHRATLVESDGSTITFAEGSGETFTTPVWSQDILKGSSSAGYKLTIEDQTVYKFAGSTGRLESVTDRNGNATTLAYNGSGNLETITDPAGRTIKLAYNSEGLVESATDPMKHVVKYTYEGGNLATVTQPGETALRWQFKYNSSHELTEMTDGRSGKSIVEYNGSNQVISQTDPMKRVTSFEYTAFHTTVTNHATGAVTVQYFTSSGLPTSVTHGYGTTSATTEFRTYNAAGDLLTVTDGNGHTTKYGYDAHSNRTSMIDPDNNETKWTYDSTHDVETETKPNKETTTIKRTSDGDPEVIERPAPGGKTQITKYKYGSHGEVESMTDPLERTWKYEYDTAGDKTAETDPEGDKRTWGYNEDSQETSMVSPRGHVSGAKESEFTTTTERDAQGRAIKVTDPLSHETKYTYDGDDNVETVTDPEGHKTTYTYDADNEQTKVEESNKTITETEYDGAGQVKKQIDGNKHATEYVRNVLEQVIEVIDPLGRKTLKEYDKAGNLVGVTNAAKQTTTYKYDPANRLTEISYSDGKTPTVKYEYNGDGDLTKMVDGTGTTTYEYDQLDRMTATKDGHGNTAGYEYDLANEQTKITYPNGKIVEREYDKAGRLKSTTDWSKNTIKYSYDADSDLATTVFPSGTSDEDTYKYDDTDAMTEVKMKKGSETLASLAYTRNKDELVEKATSKGLPGEEKPAYTYDKDNRLTKGVGIPYEYDAANNPTTIGTEHTYSYNAADELEKGVLKKATAATYTYNEAGERTKTEPASGPATTYGYDQAGNLISVTRPKGTEVAAIEDAYGYNGDGLRTSETISGITTYLAWDLAEKLPLILNDGVNSYIYGPGSLPVEQINNSGGTVLYLHRDQQGSTRLLTGSTGKAEATFTYDAYGNKTGNTGTSTTPMGYDGQYTNADTGLIYLRAREYDPATAQFMSVDPAVAATGAPYSYASDNPVNQGDPFGLIAWSPRVKKAVAQCQAWKRKSGSPYWKNKVDYESCQNLLQLPSQVYGTGSKKSMESEILSHAEAAAQDMVAMGWEGVKQGALDGCALGASSAIELGPPGMAGVCSVTGSVGAIVIGIPSALSGGVFGALTEEKLEISP